jgi:hypothetical protein
LKIILHCLYSLQYSHRTFCSEVRSLIELAFSSLNLYTYMPCMQLFNLTAPFKKLLRLSGVYYYYYYYYLLTNILQLSCHSVAVFLTLVHVRKNVHKQNKTKNCTNNSKHSKYKYTFCQKQPQNSYNKGQQDALFLSSL